MLHISTLLQYPYPYRTIAVLVTGLVLIVLGLTVYGIYRLIIRKMTEKGRAVFHRILKVAGIYLLVLCFAELVVSLITQHQVNTQLGFNYATPETPEGELFEIIRVDSGKIMEQSGLELYDRVQMSSVGELYRLLLDNQGKEVAFSVLRDQEVVEIRVMVPILHVPLRRITVLF